MQVILLTLNVTGMKRPLKLPGHLAIGHDATQADGLGDTRQAGAVSSIEYSGAHPLSEHQVEGWGSSGVKHFAP